MNLLPIHDLIFEPYMSEAQIRQRVAELGEAIQRDYANRQPLFVVMLKGAAVFAADLVRACTLECELAFVRLASYQGVQSTGSLVVHLAPNPEEIRHRDVIVVEDIVDTGHTLSRFLPLLRDMEPRSLAVASLLVKPDMLQHPEIEVDYSGFSIPPRFVVGYGLDYDGLGRNLPALYVLAEQ
jgi:hypoxanthine phosphoribosyltransferase